MIKRIIGCLLAVVMASLLAVGCTNDGVPSKYATYNLNVKAREPRFENIDIYYDISSDMKDQLSDENFEKMVYCAYSVANDMVTSTDKELKLFTAGSDIVDLENVSLADAIKDEGIYLTDNFPVLKNVVGSIDSKDLSVIVTDLAYQLDDYSSLGNDLMEKVLADDLAVGVIGVNSEKRPYFIFVIGDNPALSEFIESFKAKPDVLAYSRENDIESDFQLDITRNVNYEIFANHNGIEGIDYENVKFVENGIIYVKDGADGDTSSEKETDEALNLQNKPTSAVGDDQTVQALGGSFTKINMDAVSEEYLDTIEGTINYSDISAQEPLCKEKPPKKNRNGEDVDGITYLAVRSLVTAENAGLQGKAKMEIPFRVIDGVMLSRMDCDVSAKLYTTNGTKFKEYDGKCSDYFSVKMSEGAIPEQGKWRVNDSNDSVIFNIYAKDASAFPKTKDYVRLDISFKHYASGSAPAWVQEWNEKSIGNLSNFFDTMYKQQVKLNSAENTLTVYIASGDAEEKNR